MKESNYPMKLWDYCAERRARINNLTAKDLFQLQGQTPHFTVTGAEGDLSNVCQFAWYEWCYFREQRNSFPLPQEILGRILGPAKDAGNLMAQWVLKSNGNIAPRRTCHPLRKDELISLIKIKKRTIFDDLIKKRHGDSVDLPVKTVATDDWTEYEDNDESSRTIPEADDPVDSSGAPIGEQPSYDQLINAEVLLAQGEHFKSAKVLGRAKDQDGNLSGTYDDNPMLNTMVYNVEFPDGMIKEYSANVIAENMYAQVDSEGFQYNLLESIIDYATDDSAVATADKYVVTRRGARKLRKTTIGWKLLVLWRDGNQQWIPLKDLKESNPVEVAEFAKSRDIDNEPAFCWWTPYTLRKRDMIIAAVNSRVKKSSHKYGIEIPSSVAHAHRIDTANGNTFC